MPRSFDMSTDYVVTVEEVFRAGSVLYRAGGSRTLAPVDAVLLEPGARVGVGRRSVRFLPYDVSLPSAFRRSATPDGATA